MRAWIAPVAAVVALLAGCSQSADCEPVGAADCGIVVRLQDVEYVEIGFTRQPATRFADAELAACHDVGQDAEGSCFEETPEKVVAYSFAGQDPTTVIAIRAPGNQLRVMLAADASAESESSVRTALLGTR